MQEEVALVNDTTISREYELLHLYLIVCNMYSINAITHNIKCYTGTHIIIPVIMSICTKVKTLEIVIIKSLNMKYRFHFCMSVKRHVVLSLKDYITSRYRLGDQIGKGGFGDVYEGRRLEDDLKVRENK